MKINKKDFIEIISRNNCINSEGINYEKWVVFIESHPQCFIWHEETKKGQQELLVCEKLDDWAKKILIHSLNKIVAYGIKRSEKFLIDFSMTFRTNEKELFITLEHNMTKEIATLLLEMAQYLDAKIMINFDTELNSVDQLQ